MKILRVKQQDGTLVDIPFGVSANTGSDADISIHNTDSSAHADIREQISQLSSEKVDTTQLNSAVTNALTQAKLSGEFDGKDYVLTEADKEETAALVAILIKENAVIGIPDENGDILLSGTLAERNYSFKFILEDGSTADIGELNLTKEEEPEYTNQIPKSIGSDGKPFNGGQGWKANTRLNSSGAESSDTGLEVTGFIPVKQGDVVRLKNIDWSVKSGATSCKAYIWLYKSDFATATLSAGTLACIRELDDIASVVEVDANGKLAKFTVSKTVFEKAGMGVYKNFAEVAYIRVSAYDINSNSIITVNEEIV